MSHPFSKYIQALGKGRRGSRDLSMEESRAAMQMILKRQVGAEQLGAFLMLMRIKEETPAELAGLVGAARAYAGLPSDFPIVDLDWACYAAKRRQLPWLVLSTLLLAQQGIKVLLHGSHVPGRVSVEEALANLGIAACDDYRGATTQLALTNIAYIPLQVLNPELQKILELKSTLGLRSPMHSVVRMLNPARAAASMIGIFHPGYDLAHQAAAALLGDKNLAVFKGEGGEAERNPDSECVARMVVDGLSYDESWPAMFEQRHLKDEELDISRLGRVWRGELDDEYAQATVIGTTAIALRAMGKANDIKQAEQLAGNWWQKRDRNAVKAQTFNARPIKGTVALVGAGPGDPELLTLRALRLIQRADVVVYDNLVAPDIVAMSPDTSEKIFVGKQRAKHTLPQEAINDLLVRLALEGKKVVRLKGGDPFIFGRGGEEIETLAQHRISFEVVPGITAASGVSAYAGIPLTHRDHAQSCVFVTGHLKDGSMNLDWDALARPHQTVVVYMGLLGVETLCAKLVDHGMDATTPAALIQQGTTENQRVLSGTLSTLPEIVQREKPQAPTLIIVGGVVSLRDKLNWFSTNSVVKEFP
ncbi:MAG: glycosyl transferase family protein [Gallionella sp.]